MNLRQKFKRKFTKWYVKRGYGFGYNVDSVYIDSENMFSYPTRAYDAVFTCPWWVKPLLIFFSPSVYFMEAYGRIVAESFEQGMKSARGLRSNIQIIDEFAGIKESED